MASDDRELKSRRDAGQDTRMAETTERLSIPPAAPKTNTDAILVLGMHRSGTSAVARVLNLMGAYVGEDADLMPAHERDNPTGYWERRELVIAHDDFLLGTGHAWDRVADFDAQKLDADAVASLQARVRKVALNQASHGTPWLIKDPRLCLLLPIWLGAAPDAACVVAVRDPREIAASMRESHRGVYTSHFLLALWEKYLRTALMALQGRRVLFVSYAQLLANPEAQSERMRKGLEALGLKSLQAPSNADLRTFLDTQLRRSKPKAHMELSAPQRQLFDWLDTQCNAPGPITADGLPTAVAPDSVLREFERMLDDNAARSRAAALGESAQRLAELRTAIADQHARLLDQITAAHAESASLREQIGLTAVHVSNLEHQISNLEQHDSAVTLESVTRQARIDELAGQMQSQDAQHRTAFEQLQAEHQLTQQHASALDRRVAALRGSLSWKITAPLRGIADLFSLRLSWNIERSLYRAYYAMPGLSAARKRAFIEWLHRRVGWLTRNTLSHKMHTQAWQLREQRQADATPLGLQRLDQQRADVALAALRNPPLISLVMPVYNVERQWLIAAVDSVCRQFYPHWELCIADDASTRAETRQALDELAARCDQRIKIRRVKQNTGIAGASNAALELASGDYVGLLDNDDELSRDALIEMAQRIVADDPDLLYSDEDKLDADGRHVEPHFKPDFSPDYFFTNNYVCHFSVVRRELLQQIGGFRTGFDGAQDFDLLLRITERTDKIVHIPKVLYHWRKIAGSTSADAAAKPHTTDAGRRALAESLQRRGIDARVDPGPFPNTFNVRRPVRGEPRVSIIIPFRDQPELLRVCINSILDKSSYRNFEIVGVDNQSCDPRLPGLMRELQRRDRRVRFLGYDAPFNYSALNNFAVKQTDGEHLLLLNNDTEVVTADWIECLLEHSQRPEVGAVGAKLMYPDGTLQHAGVVVGLGGVAGHPHLFLPAEHPGYFARAQLVQNLSAVTFACAMTRRDVFEQLGGLNERDLAVAFNDVDYCLRAREAGYLLVYTPNAVLYHHESKSRGYEDNPDKQKRFNAETDYIQQRHAIALKRGDPYYNPNLSLMHAFEPADDYVAALPR